MVSAFDPVCFQIQIPAINVKKGDIIEKNGATQPGHLRRASPLNDLVRIPLGEAHTEVNALLNRLRGRKGDAGNEDATDRQQSDAILPGTLRLP